MTPASALVSSGPQLSRHAVELLALALAIDEASARALIEAPRAGARDSLRSRVDDLVDGRLAVPGVGPARRKQLAAALTLAQLLVGEPLLSGQSLRSPAECIAYLQHCFLGCDREVFVCLFLDCRNRVLACEELFRGTVDAAPVYPRVVVTRALALGATGVIAAHNHPSGSCLPSDADRRITRRLVEALALVDVRLLDHIIVGFGDSASLAELGEC